jgi:hypothetical protein
MLSEFRPAVFKNQKRSDLQISNSNYAVIEDGEKRTSFWAFIQCLLLDIALAYFRESESRQDRREKNFLFT